jgi:hypothetical protein
MATICRRLRSARSEIVRARPSQNEGVAGVNGVEHGAGLVGDFDRHVQKLALMAHRIRHQIADAGHRISPGFEEAGEFLSGIVQNGIGAGIQDMEEKQGHLRRIAPPAWAPPTETWSAFRRILVSV